MVNVDDDKLRLDRYLIIFRRRGLANPVGALLVASIVGVAPIAGVAHIVGAGSIVGAENREGLLHVYKMEVDGEKLAGGRVRGT
jgi:hypothetical protein